MEKENQKVSKLIVFLFILAIFNLVGIIFSGFSYDMMLSQVISVVINALLIWWAYYLRKRAINKNFSGLKMASFAFYAFIVTTILDLIVVSFFLISYNNKLKEFAIQQTPTFFSDNLSNLKNNSTDNLKRVLSYEAETSDMLEKFSAVGQTKECVREKNNTSQVNVGFYFADSDKLTFGVRGFYSVRCYGENKPFDFMAAMEHKDGKWLIDDYNFYSEIGKDFDIKEAENNQ